MDDARFGRDKPHDGLFRKFFSNAYETAQMLRAMLPEPARSLVDWDSLSSVESSFVDGALRHSESDLVFDARLAATGAPAQVCVLLEHQSSPDRRIPLRLLDYGTGLWNRRYDDDPKAYLPSVLPVVLYQGKTPWRHSKQFADLLPPAVRDLPWTPRFEHVLLDQTLLAPDDVAGGDRGRLTQLLLMAWARVGEKRRAALDAALPLLSRVAKMFQWEGVRPFLVYAGATLEREEAERFMRGAGAQGEEGELLMTFSEELLKEGLEEGLEKGREEGERSAILATVERMLRRGMDWDTIRAVTDIDEPGLAALRQQVSGA